MLGVVIPNEVRNLGSRSEFRALRGILSEILRLASLAQDDKGNREILRLASLAQDDKGNREILRLRGFQPLRSG